MPDEAIYAERALDALAARASWSVLHGRGRRLRACSTRRWRASAVRRAVWRTGYASLKLLQALDDVAGRSARLLLRAPVHAPRVRAARGSACPRLAAASLLGPRDDRGPVLSHSARSHCWRWHGGRDRGTLRDQAIALASVAAAMLTQRPGGGLLVVVFAAAIVVDALLAPRAAARLRAFWPVWARCSRRRRGRDCRCPGLFGAYSGTLHGQLPARPGGDLTVRALELRWSSRRRSCRSSQPCCSSSSKRRGEAAATRRARGRRGGRRARRSSSSAQVGFFAARYAPHLLGRDLALLPPLLFTVFALWLAGCSARRAPAGVFDRAARLLALLVLRRGTTSSTSTALPDTFGVAILCRLGCRHAAAAVAAVSRLLLVVVVPPRSARRSRCRRSCSRCSSVVECRRLQRRSPSVWHPTSAISWASPRDWVDQRVTRARRIPLDGESYWNGVWQAAVLEPQRSPMSSARPVGVPGPMKQQRVTVPSAGRLPDRDALIVASDPHDVRRARRSCASRRLGLDSPGLTLWRLDGPARLTTVERGSASRTAT